MSSADINIGCWATDFFSGLITFSWKDYSNDSNKVNFMAFPSVYTSDTFSASSLANVPVAEWKSCYPFYCSAGDKTIKVVHPNNVCYCESGIGRRMSRFTGLDTTGGNSYPNVNVETIRPSFEDIFKKDLAKLTCRISNLLSNANFSSLDVTWTQGIDKKPLETKLGQPMDQENGLQYVEATTMVHTAEWNSRETFSCKVNFPGVLPEPVEKSLKKSTGGPSFPPSVYIFPPPSEELALKETATLICMMSGFYPNEVFVQWLQNNQPVKKTKYITSKPTQESEIPGQYFAYSKLTANEQDWSNGDRYTCVVGHEALPLYTTQKTIDKSMGSDVNCSSNVHVETIPPSFADIYQTNSAKLTCKISNIPLEFNIRMLNVTWTQGYEKKTLNTELGEPKHQGNNWKYIEATAMVPPTEWNSEETFNCKVVFPDLLPEPVEKSLKKLTGKSSFPPSVYVLPPSSELTLKETGTLTCLVKGFLPGDIFVQWLHNDQPMSTEDYFTSRPTLESKTPERYFAYSMLNINPQNWSSGDMYSCLVAHEALPFNTTQKAVGKNTEAADIHILSEAYLDRIMDIDEDEELQKILSVLSTFIVLFLVSLFYSVTVTVIKVK